VRLRILLPFRNASALRLQGRLGRLIREAGHEVGFLNLGGRTEALAAREEARSSDARVYELYSEESQPAQDPRVRLGAARSARARCIAGASRAVAGKAYGIHLRSHHAELSAARKILAEFKPTTVIVNEDGVSGPLHLIAAARDEGVGVLDVPFGYFSAAEFDGDLARKKAEGDLRTADGAAGLVLRLFAPQWVRRQGPFAGAVMFDPDYLLALEAAGITLRDAWTVHGGISDRLCAESSRAMRMYVQEGIPAGKIALTGSPYCDFMVRSAADSGDGRRDLLAPGPIEPGGPIRVLVSWPPSYHESLPGRSEFGSYEEMTRTILGFLRDLPGCALTVSLHPAVGSETRAMLHGAGVPVSDEYVIDLIPRNDVFVTHFSSTIRWATAAGKPVVNYDAYRIGLRIFDSGGFVSLQTFSDFRQVIAELVSSADTYRAFNERQLAEAPEWGILDGECTARILTLAQGLSS
jgi:hypothetical protein